MDLVALQNWGAVGAHPTPGAQKSERRLPTPESISSLISSLAHQVRDRHTERPLQSPFLHMDLGEPGGEWAATDFSPSFPVKLVMGGIRRTNYCTIALISHASKLTLKILQARLQQHVNWELPDVQAGFRKWRRTRDQISNICWIIEKAREFQKDIYLCVIDYAKGFGCVGHNKLWKILKEMRIPDHLTCLLRNLYARQEATVRNGHGTTDWFQIGKGVPQGCILSPCLFNLYAEYIMWNGKAGLSRSWNQDFWEKYQ